MFGSAGYGCGSVERTYMTVDGGSAGSSGSDGGKKDGAIDGFAGSGGSGGGGATLDAGDANIANDAAIDADDSAPPPPPPPGRPGISIVAGGMLMKSPMYKAFVATGEAPGANGVMSSPKYKFVGGVIGTTQPK
jgi:hypothetical protein